MRGLDILDPLDSYPLQETRVAQETLTNFVMAKIEEKVNGEWRYPPPILVNVGLITRGPGQKSQILMWA